MTNSLMSSVSGKPSKGQIGASSTLWHKVCGHQQPAATITRKAQILLENLLGKFKQSHDLLKKLLEGKTVLFSPGMDVLRMDNRLYSSPADCPSNCSVDAFAAFNAFPAARGNTKFLLSPLAVWTATSPAAAALQQMRKEKKLLQSSPATFLLPSSRLSHGRADWLHRLSRK